MSTLEASLDRFEGTLVRILTALEGVGFDARELDTLTECYTQADRDLNEALQRARKLPQHFKPKVDRIHGIHMLVKHMMNAEMAATTAKISKVRVSRKALGQNSHAEFVSLGGTGIDCNLHG
jgi:hypothetical protein